MIHIPLEQAQAIRAYLGTRPFDEVAAACVWLDAAIRAAQSVDQSRLERMRPAPPSADSDLVHRSLHVAAESG